MQSETTTPPGVQRLWQGAASYDQAVEAAGVTELPDDRGTPRGLPAKVAGGRWEDSKPPVVSR